MIKRRYLKSDQISVYGTWLNTYIWETVSGACIKPQAICVLCGSLTKVQVLGLIKRHNSCLKPGS